MGNIVVLGPRSSGKTSMLAGLAYWPKRRDVLHKKSSFAVQPLNDDARQLQTKAENIMLEGGSLEATKVSIGGVTELPVYSFKIDVKQRLKKIETLNLVVKDYAGEIFDELSSNSLKPEHEEFIEECLMKDVNGCLILLSGWQREDDKYYTKIIDTFTDLIDYYQRREDYRLAIAVSKCERGELWPGRLEPEIDLFNVHLPLTQFILKEKILQKNLRFYALSTFGVLRKNDPRPNRIDELGTNGKASVLREPSRWRPYNLIAPLYWLSTGKTIGSNV